MQQLIPKEDALLPQEPASRAAWLSPVQLHRLLLLYCIVSALSIALSQIVLGAALLLALLLIKKDRSLFFAVVRNNPLLPPMLLWLGACLFASFGGVAPGRAVSQLIKTSVYTSLPFIVQLSFAAEKITDLRGTTERLRLYIYCLLFGQGLASLHSIAEAAAGFALPPGLPGPVTQSGQLALLLPCALMIITLRREAGAKALLDLTLLAMLFFALSLSAWGEMLPMPDAAQLLKWSATGGALVLTAIYLHSLRALPSDKRTAKAALLSFSICAAAFLINLKRGPWLGAAAALGAISLAYSRRFVAPLLLFALLLAAFPQARTRVLNLQSDFTIPGGRQAMWALGTDLLGRYPLGLGIYNANYMRNLDKTLPPLHRHMHNNLLNVAVETGWIGLASFVWWMAVAILLGWRIFRKLRTSDHRAALAGLGLSAGLLSWQAAGLVEYNFGDGEVRLIALFFMGLLLALNQNVERESGRSG